MQTGINLRGRIQFVQGNVENHLIIFARLLNLSTQLEILHIPSEISKVGWTTAEETGNWKAALRENAFLKISNGETLQGDWPPNHITIEIIIFQNTTFSESACVGFSFGTPGMRIFQLILNSNSWQCGLTMLWLFPVNSCVESNKLQ